MAEANGLFIYRALGIAPPTSYYLYFSFSAPELNVTIEI